MITNAMFHHQTYVYIQLRWFTAYKCPPQSARTWSSASLLVSTENNHCTSQDLGRSQRQHCITIMASKGAAIKLYTNHRCPCKCISPLTPGTAHAAPRGFWQSF